MARSSATLLAACAALSLSIGCSASTEKPAVSLIMAGDDSRAASLEATARVLDEHPAYVDEFFVVAQKHPRLLERFLQNAAAQMEDPGFSKQVAAHLAEHPAAIREVMKATVDASMKRVPARIELARSIGERAAELADILTDSPHATRVITEAQADAMMKKEGAKKALLAAMRSRAAEFAAVLVYDPETLHVMLTAMVAKARTDKLAMKDLFASILPESLEKPADPRPPPAPSSPAAPVPRSSFTGK